MRDGSVGKDERVKNHAFGDHCFIHGCSVSHGLNHSLLHGRGGNRGSFSLSNLSSLSCLFGPFASVCFPGSLRRAFPPNLSFVMISLTRVCIISDSSRVEIESTEHEIKKSDFPCDFLFGVSTSAAQIEGAALTNGKGPSVWDEFAKIPGKIRDGSNPSVALDSYFHYKEDIAALKELGVNTYRFSISWSRILPNGTIHGGINQDGIDYYNKLINELVENDIKPFVTILHFDYPQALQDQYGGFLSRSIVVKNWITINEPYITSRYGHEAGVSAPGRCTPPTCPAGNSSIEPYIATHHQLLAHAAAVKLYRKKFQKSQNGEIGICHVGKYYEPYSKSAEDKAARARAMDFAMGWFLDPIVHGDYPEIMKDLVKERLPIFTEEEKKLLKGSFDFIGINYYTSEYAYNIPKDAPRGPPMYSTDALVNITNSRNGVPIGPQAEGIFWLHSYPRGLEKLLKYINKKYKGPKLYVTENGVSEANVKDRPLAEALDDPHRIDCLKQHLIRTKNALKDGVNVKGYMHWTLADNWEWGEGYLVRFGLYYTDYTDNLKRIPKKSARWYRSFLLEDGIC